MSLTCMLGRYFNAFPTLAVLTLATCVSRGSSLPVPKPLLEAGVPRLPWRSAASLASHPCKPTGFENSHSPTSVPSALTPVHASS